MKWDEEQLPELVPVVTNRKTLESQHLLVLVRDALGEVGQGVISLNDAAGTNTASCFFRGEGANKLIQTIQRRLSRKVQY